VRGYRNKVYAVLSLLESAGSIKELVAWLKLSLPSYTMVSDPIKQELLPRTVLEVGANVGQFAVAAAKLLPDVSVHSFEPVPVCVKKLQKNVSGLGNVAVYLFALGDREDKVTFRVASQPLTAIRARPSRWPKATGTPFPNALEMKTIEVKVLTLGQFLRG